MKFGKNAEIASKEFNSEPVYNRKYLKTKIKSCQGKTNRNFPHSKIQKNVIVYKIYLFRSNID